MKCIISFLQVMCGDGIVIQYEEEGHRKNIVVDGGYLTTYMYALQPALNVIAEKKGHIDTWILTHLDADHINGFVSFLRDPDTRNKPAVSQLWFNCFDRFTVFKPTGLISVGKGIEIRDTLKSHGIVLDNQITSGKRITDGEFKLTVLSPDRPTFNELAKFWEKEEAKYHKNRTGGLVAGKVNDYGQTIAALATKKDPKEKTKDITNRSSITFILKLGQKQLLFLGDAYPSQVIVALNSIRGGSDQRLRFEYVKLSHHGSKHNFAASLLDIIECNNFIISSNGDNQHHLPDKQTLARILLHPKRERNVPINFLFNYDNPTLRSIFKADKNSGKIYNFKCLYPKKNKRCFEIKFSE